MSTSTATGQPAMDVWPRAMRLHEAGDLDTLLELARHAWRACRCCPRACGVDRLAGERGYCDVGRLTPLVSASVVFGQEPPVSGHRGSGAVCLVGGPMRSLFGPDDQNRQMGGGREVSADELGAQLLDLQRRGCHNISVVSGAQSLLPVLEGVVQALRLGFHLPLLWNSTGYESRQGLDLLEPIVDIWLPDVKYRSRALAAAISDAPDYPSVNGATLRRLWRHCGPLRTDAEGIGRSGLLVRHLVLPGRLDNTAACLAFLTDELSPDVAVSLRGQYRPPHGGAGRPDGGWRLCRDEFRQGVELLDDMGLTNGWFEPLDGLPDDSRADRGGAGG